MQASEKTLLAWKDLKEQDDVKSLAAILGLSAVRASQILNSGKGSVTQIACIQKFYKERKKAVAKIEDDNN